MSRIRRLSIRGVRNFGTEKDEAFFRFSRPLTLILGPNGTGKTTIIESLKFATTGEFPPDSDKGKAFIHDPVYTIGGNVRCAIKIEIIDKDENVTVITRTLESTKFAGKSQMKTLDNCITRQRKGSAQPTSVTNRCVDADVEAALAMGVSKPILKYVIFCHQEDLNWPFDSGKALKERFDEIFDTVKFNKALENITKCHKQLQGEMSVLKSEKHTCEVLVAEVKSREKKLADHKERLQDCENNVKDIEDDLEMVQENLKTLESSDRNYKTLLTQEEKKKMEYNMSKQQMMRLKSNIKEMFEGSNEELQDEISAYDNDFASKVAEMYELKDKLQYISGEESQNRNKLAKERINVGTLKQQVKDYEQKMKLRNQVLNEALAACDLDTVDSDMSEIELEAHTRRLAEKHREAQYKAEENRLIREQQERDVQREVDNARVEHSKIESEKELNEKELANVQRENTAISKLIKEIGVSSNKLDMIKSKIERAKNKVTELSLAMNVDSVREEIESKTNQRNTMDALLNKMDTEIAALHKQNSLQTELEFYMSSLSEKRREIKKIEGKWETIIKELFNVTEFPNKKLKTDIEKIQQQLINEIKKIEQQLQEKECDLTTLETILKFKKQELVKVQNELQSDKDEVAAVCDYKEFDEALVLQLAIVKDLQDKRGLCVYEEAAYKKYLKQLQKVDPCCPLCHRDFADSSNVEQVMKEMKEQIKNHPNRMKECEAQLKIHQAKYDKMLQLKPCVERILSVETVELEKIRENTENTTKKISQCRGAISELTSAKVKPEGDVAKIKQVLSDIIMRDKYMDEVNKLENTINSIKMRLSSAGIHTEYTVEEAQAKRDELKDSVKKIREEIEQLQLNLNKHNEELQDARSECNALHEEQLKIHSNMQKLKQLKDQQEVLYSKEILLRDSIFKLVEKLSELGSCLQLKIKNLNSRKQEISQKAEADRTLIMESQKRISDLSKIQDEVNSFRRRKIKETLSKCEATIEFHEKLTNELNEKRTKVESSLSKLKEHLTHQEVRKRELSDNMLYRDTETATQELHEELMRLQNELRSINYDDIKWKKSNFQTRHETLLRKRNTLLGSQDELKRNIQQCTNELKQEIYRNARRTLKKKSIQLTVLHETIANLKAYSKVLDAITIKHHEERMASVNKIIKKLWQVVYTGSDTSSIQIRTDATQGVGSLRRSYNYKLIQTKRGHEIDMKGRCSAGQRVLASIIIRLALAETFCKDCGILALDEPTTNLDEDNARSLANALSSVISYRTEHQKNLQLIVISHDERFLCRLAALNNYGGFYELYRRPNGLTSVRVRDMSAIDGLTSGQKRLLSSDDEESDSVQTPRKRPNAVLDVPNSSSTSCIPENKTSAWDDGNTDRPEARKKIRVFKYFDIPQSEVQ